MTKLNLKELRELAVGLKPGVFGYGRWEGPSAGTSSNLPRPNPVAHNLQIMAAAYSQLPALLDWIERAKETFECLEELASEGFPFGCLQKCEPDCTCVRHDWVKLLAELEES